MIRRFFTITALVAASTLTLTGVMLDLVIDDLKDREFEAVEAGPRTDSYGDKSYRGSKDMFLKRGFEEVADLGDGFVLVRKCLA